MLNGRGSSKRHVHTLQALKIYKYFKKISNDTVSFLSEIAFSWKKKRMENISFETVCA